VPQKGQIRGLIDSRDIIVPQYQDKLDTLARTLVDKINALHQKGYSLNGISGNSFFNASVTGASDISLAPAITADVKNIAAAAGGASMPAAANTSAAGAHSFGGAPVQLVRDPAATVIVPAKNIVAGTVTVSNGSQLLSEGADYHIDYASGTLQMLHAGFNAAALTINFQFMTSGFNGPEDNGTAIAIAQLRSNPAMEPDVLGNPTASFVESYSSLVGQIGSDKNAAKSNLDTRDFLVQQYESSQDAIAGVSLDEEMSNLIKFQHTYQASAHLITVAQKMLDALMNM
jgi:flagellar hook-associated protein 1 FlgK